MASPAALLDSTRVQQKSREIKQRTQTRLQQSSSLRNLARINSPPRSSATARPRSSPTQPGGEDDDDFCVVSPEAASRTALRDRQMASIRQATLLALQPTVHSVFTEESIMQAQEPTPGWRSSKHLQHSQKQEQQQQEKSWAQGLRGSGGSGGSGRSGQTMPTHASPSATMLLAAAPLLSAAPPSRLVAINRGHGTALGSATPPERGAAPRESTEEAQQTLLPLLQPAPASHGPLPHSASPAQAMPMPTAEEAARYFGPSARALFNKTYRELERQKNIVDYHYARSDYSYRPLPSPAAGSIVGAGSALLHLSERDGDALHRSAFALPFLPLSSFHSLTHSLPLVQTPSHPPLQNPT